MKKNKLFHEKVDLTPEQEDKMYYIYDDNFLFNAALLFPKIYIFTDATSTLGVPSIFGRFNCDLNDFVPDDFIAKKIKQTSNLIVFDCRYKEINYSHKIPRYPLPNSREEIDEILKHYKSERFIIKCNSLYYQSTLKELFRPYERVFSSDEANIDFYETYGIPLKPCCDYLS